MIKLHIRALQILLTLSLCVSMSCNKDLGPNHIARAKVQNIKMNDMFGINAFEWDFLQNPNDLKDIDQIYEPNLALIKSFTQVRHYLDWEKIEDKQNDYTFNPTHRGGWNLDLLYTRAKKENLMMLVCIKNVPDWLYNTYPAQERNNEIAPIAYKADRQKPASYLALGKAAFQFAARYGKNKSIDSSLVKVNTVPRWNGDRINTVKIGMDLVKYVECSNEPDKWWRGKAAEMTPMEYAANLSAFYDGHKGTLGKNVGIKTADTSIKVVLGGLAKADLNYIKAMVQWCKDNRGLNKDGSVNLCFDVINYHLYSNDNTGWFKKFVNKKRGVAPELNVMGDVADEFVDYAATLAPASRKIEVWTTESGYDLQPTSVQRAIPIGDKSAEVVQADWILRSALLYARHGVSKNFFYQLFDTDAPGTSSGGPFGTSGFVTHDGKRPVAHYFSQVSKFMGDYTYYGSMGSDPIVDIYKLGKKEMFVLAVPDEVDRKEEVELDLKGAKVAVVYTLKPNSDDFDMKTIPTDKGKITITATETPQFVQGI